YNARNAYSNYGFQNFTDTDELGFGADWEETDAKLMNGVVERLTRVSQPDVPIFAYVVTIENHAPHPCKHFSNETQFVTTLIGATFDLNCQLNEYLSRLKSTDQGLSSIVQFL